MNKPLAHQVVGDVMIATDPSERPVYLRELLAHIAAALVVTEGDKAAMEACYRVGDAVLSRRVGKA